jgi:Na+/H+ antiporter NhaD/arsenite permease-like protein
MMNVEGLLALPANFTSILWRSVRNHSGTQISPIFGLKVGIPVIAQII